MPLKWTEEEIADLRDMYPDNDTEDVAIVLGRSVLSVTQKACSLKIGKSQAYMRRRLKKCNDTGKQYRFLKGHIPWNAATVGVCGQHPNTRKTQFKKGQPPKTALYDGAIRVRYHTGVPAMFIRVGPNEWEPLSRHNWKKHFGPIPPGHVIRFKDGDPMNCDPSNLECVSKRLNMLINSKHGYTREQAEVKEVCVLINEHINNGSGDG